MQRSKQASRCSKRVSLAFCIYAQNTSVSVTLNKAVEFFITIKTQLFGRMGVIAVRSLELFGRSFTGNKQSPAVGGFGSGSFLYFNTSLPRCKTTLRKYQSAA